ncbi:hypothetical protein [Xanthomonas albilineans]|nr:hypothetical protein [Xanthomonas albilineans]
MHYPHRIDAPQRQQCRIFAATHAAMATDYRSSLAVNSQATRGTRLMQ